MHSITQTIRQARPSGRLAPRQIARSKLLILLADPVVRHADARGPNPQRSLMPGRGAARYFSVTAGGSRAIRAAWSYPDPTPACYALKDHVALYVAQMDACCVDDEQARPQPGGFYGGLVTADVIGPFKGRPGSEGW